MSTSPTQLGGLPEEPVAATVQPPTPASVVSTVLTDVKTVQAAVPGAIGKLLAFFKHPGLNTALGVALAALSAFTALVPANNRNPTTTLGIIYAIVALVIDRLPARS